MSSYISRKVIFDYYDILGGEKDKRALIYNFLPFLQFYSSSGYRIDKIATGVNDVLLSEMVNWRKGPYVW